jgi:hypothetical protein
MMTALMSNGTRTVVVERLDRVARDLMVQESILADFKRKGLEVVSVAEPDLCSHDPSRVLMRQMFASDYHFGKQPLWPGTLWQRNVAPAIERAGIIKPKLG